MKHTGLWSLATAIAVCSQFGFPVEAARKYYPPGFTPPPDSRVLPAPSPTPAPQVMMQQAPVEKQVIIKTVPVQVSKPIDPLTILLQEHRYFNALRLVDERLQKSPNSLSLQLMRGRILRGQHTYAQALTQFGSALAKAATPASRSDVWTEIGWTYYQQANMAHQMGEDAAAKNSLQSGQNAFYQALKLTPNRYSALAGLGQIALANHQPQEAETWIKKAKRLAPNQSIVQMSEAKLLLAKQQPEEALSLLYSLKKSTTNEPEVFLLLAEASLQSNKVDDAIINLKQLLDVVPDHTKALKLLSDSYERKMKPEDAEDVLSKAISLNPQDEASVSSLLKIYDQRQEQDRSILLLKTLLKNTPNQITYGNELLRRLIAKGQWDEAYLEGSTLMSAISTETTLMSPASQTLVYLFARTVYQKSRGLLDPQELDQETAVQAAQSLCTQWLQNPDNPNPLQTQLSLLLLNPLVALPAEHADFYLTRANTLPTWIQALCIAFLQGKQSLQQQLLSDSMLQAFPPQAHYQAAYQLYTLGDYQGASSLLEEVLAKVPDSKEAHQLQHTIAQDRRAIQDHLTSLAVLPNKISDDYWQKVAAETLRLGNGDWETHGAIAKSLEKRKNLPLALIHQRLAAQYSPTQKDRAYWAKKAEKTASALPAVPTNR